jgi:hypothetical protein
VFFPGNGRQAIAAPLGQIQRVVAGSSGTLYISDPDNSMESLNKVAALVSEVSAATPGDPKVLHDLIELVERQAGIETAAKDQKSAWEVSGRAENFFFRSLDIEPGILRCMSHAVNTISGPQPHSDCKRTPAGSDGGASGVAGDGGTRKDHFHVGLKQPNCLQTLTRIIELPAWTETRLRLDALWRRTGCRPSWLSRLWASPT